MARHAIPVAALVLAPFLGVAGQHASGQRHWLVKVENRNKAERILNERAARGARSPHDPETVSVKSGSLELRALIWRPSGSGPFPAVIFNHGSASSTDPPQAADAAILGDVFTRHGYVFLFLFRQGLGLSAGQGTASGDLMRRAFDAGGQEARNRRQMELLNGEELNDVSAALGFLRQRPEVDVKRIAVAGHSFGGSLSLVLAAKEPDIGAGVIFGGAAGSWTNSPDLRKRLLAAVGKTRAPLLFIYAANDYSIAPAKVFSAEMRRLQKVHESKIYPPFGRTTREGHNLVYGSVRTWESDVFGFLDRYLRHIPTQL